MIKIIIYFSVISIVFTCCVTHKYITNIDSLQQKTFLDSLIKYDITSTEKRLIKEANRFLEEKFKTILDKKIIAKSGKLNDYSSRAVYFWPPEKTKLSKGSENNKWQYHDGKINKESLINSDHDNYYNMLTAVKKLSLSYSLTKNKDYSRKCISLIKTWFIDKKTKMNPNFEYAQSIPGQNNGSPAGIIDARGIIWIIDSIDLIKDSGSWTAELNREFKSWVSELLEWLLESNLGKREAASMNNHGSFYDLQIIKYAHYLEKHDLAVEYIENVMKRRIPFQINRDGSQTLELERSNSQMYSIFNLSALIEMAIIANYYEINLWNYKEKKCGSVQNAVEFLVTNVINRNKKVFGNSLDERSLLVILPKVSFNFDHEYTELTNSLIKKYNPVELSMMVFNN